MNNITKTLSSKPESESEISTTHNNKQDELITISEKIKIKNHIVKMRRMVRSRSICRERGGEINDESYLFEGTTTSCPLI